AHRKKPNRCSAKSTNAPHALKSGRTTPNPQKNLRKTKRSPKPTKARIPLQLRRAKARLWGLATESAKGQAHPKTWRRQSGHTSFAKRLGVRQPSGAFFFVLQRFSTCRLALSKIQLVSAASNARARVSSRSAR